MDRWLYNYLRHEEIVEREKKIAQWMIDNPHYSVRMLAREFMISKSQVHRDLHNLRHEDDDLYVQCKHILQKHKTSRF